MSNYIEGGNLVITEPNQTNKDGSNEVDYYYMAKDWPALENGKSIIIKGDVLGETKLIRFRNGPDAMTPWHVSKINIVNEGKVNTGGISVDGLEHWSLAGDGDGLKKWAPSRKFCSGHFGFHVKTANRFSGHGIQGSCLDGGSITISGVEVQYGFSGIRLCGTPDDTVAHLDISNFYIHDTGRGECTYLGATFPKPYTRIKLKMKNGFVARPAAEALQNQHLIGSLVEDIVCFAADTDWTTAFKKGQATGLQWSVDGGENILRRIVVDGFAAQGMIPFGAGEAGKSIVEDILFNDGRNSGIYLHNSMKFGTEWLFRNIYFRAFNDSYSETGEIVRPYAISNMHGTDLVTFENIFQDASKSRVFENFKSDWNWRLSDLAAPEYYNSGFYEPASKIKMWHPLYAPYFPNKGGTKWHYGDIAIDATQASWYFCKCVTPHEASQTDPRPAHSEQFQVLTWDSEGIRSDQLNWSQYLPQFPYPPDDLRMRNWYGVRDIVQREDIIDEYYFEGKRHTVTKNKTYIA
jgi:hypothetical protein